MSMASADGRGAEAAAAETQKKSVLAHLPTGISVVAFCMSGISYYESAMRQAELAVFVPPVIHYGRDGGGDTELFAIPVTITNSGARTGTVLSMDLEVERPAKGENEPAQTKRYYSAYLGEHPRSVDVIHRAFAPASIAGRQTYSETIRFYPVGRALPRLVSETGEYRFTLRLNLAQAADATWWDRLWMARVTPTTFTLTLPWLSDQQLGIRRGSIAMHSKDHRPTTNGQQ